MGDFKKWGGPSNRGIILKWEVRGDTPLRTMLWQNNNRKRT